MSFLNLTPKPKREVSKHIKLTQDANRKAEELRNILNRTYNELIEDLIINFYKEFKK